MGVHGPAPALNEREIRQLARAAGTAHAVANGRSALMWNASDASAAIAEYQRLRGLTTSR